MITVICIIYYAFWLNIVDLFRGFYFFVFCVTIQTVISIKRFDDIMEDINMYLVEFTTYTNPAEVSYEFGSIDDVKTFLEKNRELLQSYVVVHKNGNIVKI